MKLSLRTTDDFYKNDLFKTQISPAIRLKAYDRMLGEFDSLIAEDMSEEYISVICGRLLDEKVINMKKQLPFQYLKTYRQVKQLALPGKERILEALEKAVIKSAGNLPGFEEGEKIVVGIDVSAEAHAETGFLFSALLQQKGLEVRGGIFSDKWQQIALPVSNLLAETENFREELFNEFSSPEISVVIEDLINHRRVVDKVVVFTMEENLQADKLSSIWKEYKLTSPEAKLYVFNYNRTSSVSLDIFRDDVYVVSGWSDKVFELIQAVEKASEILQGIERVEL